MIIRLGFISMAIAIFNHTPSSTFIYKLFSQRPREEAMQRASEIGRKNLEATQQILYYNAAQGIRLSMHPNQYTLLNGKDAIADVRYHAAILDGMGLDESGIINIHVGGVYGDKDAATERLFDNNS